MFHCKGSLNSIWQGWGNPGILFFFFNDGRILFKCCYKLSDRKINNTKQKEDINELADRKIA